MVYKEQIRLKDGRECVLQNGRECDGREALSNFILTHEHCEIKR